MSESEPITDPAEGGQGAGSRGSSQTCRGYAVEGAAEFRQQGDAGERSGTCVVIPPMYLRVFNTICWLRGSDSYKLQARSRCRDSQGQVLSARDTGPWMKVELEL